MKYSLSKSDKGYIKQQQERSNVAAYLRNIANNKFSIGDVLNMQQLFDWSDKSGWHTLLISDKTPVPIKYLYVHEDELGIGYVKQYTADCSEMRDMVISIAELNLDHNRFTVDPDYADHVLLTPDEPFDAAAKFKESTGKRERVRKMNKGLAMKGSVEEILSSFKKGDVFWHGDDLSCKNPWEFRVVKISKSKKQKLDEYSMGDRIVIETKCLTSGGYDRSFNLCSAGHFFLTKPCILGEQL